jgi:uncharacterized protein (TIGR04255 family)
MARIYKNPPLAEAICEIRLEYEQEWDWTIPGLFWQEIKEEFPRKRNVSTVQFQVANEGPDVNQSFRNSLSRMQFGSEDRKRVVQVGPTGIIINLVNYYSTWAEFKSLINRLLDVYLRIAPVKSIHGVAVRYINKIDLTGGESGLQKYLRVLPPLLDGLPRLISNFVVRTDYVFEEEHAALGVTLASDPEIDEPIFLLEFTFQSEDGLQFSFANVYDWIEMAHSNIETAFEASITDALRERFD